MDTQPSEIAYAAMYDFLSRYYQKTKDDGVGGLLGGMSIIGDGMTADEAMWGDWMASFDKAQNGAVDLGLNIHKTNDDS